MRQIRAARIVVVETVYHQGAGGEPTCVEVKSSTQLTTDDQPYQYDLQAGPEWKRLETGWLEKCSMLLISNEGKEPAEVGIKQTSAGETVLPLFSLAVKGSLRMPVEATALSLLHARSAKGTKLRVTVLPA